MSTNTNEQNGRQAPLSNHNTPPSDPRIENLSEHQKPVCRNYVWGICDKSSHCKFRHELVYNEMKRILKFCHDYQNKQGCARIDCSYLHATSEEQNLFLTVGQIPRVLQERYLAMCEPPDTTNFKGMPQMALFVRAPPPPPPPPAPVVAAAALPPPPPPPPPQSQQLTSFPVIQQPPPPPPPPPATTQQPYLFSAPPPQQTPVIFPMNQPPPPTTPIFDPSRPPPPLPKSIGKRRLEHREISPNKMRKGEECKLEESPCELCVQQEFRIDLLKKKMEKLQIEEEYQSLMYKKRLDEFESGKDKLKSLISPELYRILHEYIEGGPPQMQDIFSQFQNSFISGTSTVPKQLLITLMEYLFNNTRNILDPPISLTQTLTSFSRRSNNISSSSSSEILQNDLEVLRNNTTNSSVTHMIDGNKSNSPVNGFHGNNGQKNDGASGSGLSTNRHINSSEAPTQTYASVAGPGGGGYPLYQPGVPPPASRPHSYYPHQYSQNISAASQGSIRIPASINSNRPPASSVQQYSALGKYPGPQFYHPFQ